MQGSSWSPTAINAKDIQNYYAETLPNLIYSRGQKADLVNLTKASNIRQGKTDAVLKNLWMNDNEVKGSRSTVEANNAACEAIGSGDSFDHLTSLISNQDTQARMRCGWMYNRSDPMSSRGAYGVPEGPLKTSAPGTWIWNLEEAKRKQHTDICQGIQGCADIDAAMYNKRCGWCKRSGKAVPITGNKATYPFSTRTACASGDLVTSASSCPPPNSQFEDQLEGFTDGSPATSCIPLANGAIPRDCLLQKIRVAGCSDEGSLYRALRSGSDNDYISKLADQQAWVTYQQRAAIPMNQTGIQSGKITISDALNDFKRLQTQASSEALTALKYSARDLCYNKGAFDEYDVCSEIQDTATPPFSLECLQKTFLRMGGQKAGTAYPSASNMNQWNSLRSWSAVKIQIQQMLADTSSSNRSVQQKAMMDYYGIKMQDKTNLGPCDKPFDNPKNGPGYTYRGCFKDSSDRAISNFLGITKTNDECFNMVKSKGFSVMGRQNFGECWGGINEDWNKHGSAGCCQANGGGWTNQVYSVDGYVPPKPRGTPPYGRPLKFVGGGDITLYNDNRQVVVLNDNLFPSSPRGNGYKISGLGVPPNTRVVGYRFGKSNPSSRYDVIFMDLSNPVENSDDPIYYAK